MEDLLLMHEYLRRSAARSPGKTALVCGADRLAYRELEQYCPYCIMHVSR